MKKGASTKLNCGDPSNSERRLTVWVKLSQEALKALCCEADIHSSNGTKRHLNSDL